MLAGIGALHVAWGLGSSFPFRDRAALADTVVGSDAVPGRRASLAVAGLLGLAAGLVADVLPVPPTLRRVGVVGVATVLATRAGIRLRRTNGTARRGEQLAQVRDRRPARLLAAVRRTRGGRGRVRDLSAQRAQTIGVQRRMSAASSPSPATLVPVVSNRIRRPDPAGATSTSR